MSVVGADPEALRDAGRRFSDGSRALWRHRAALDAAFTSTPWRGPDADRCRADWYGAGRATLGDAMVFLDRLAVELRLHADAQQAASAPPIGGRAPERFDAPGDGRALVAVALDAVGDSERIAVDEFEIRALDNGRFVVVLPGVTDLSDGVGEMLDALRRFSVAGLDEGARDAAAVWLDDEGSTVRRTRYAAEAAVGVSENRYATAVIAALEQADVPAGAEVMIVGHSYGAYTAMDLAADRSFNAAPGGGAPGGYHVRVTHVVAAGAETDWRFRDLPTYTDVLTLNNRWDVVYQAEDVLHRDRAAIHDGQLEKVFWGGRDDWGHGEGNYSGWVEAATDHADMTRWLDEIGRLYDGGGVRVSARVPDDTPV